MYKSKSFSIRKMVRRRRRNWSQKGSPEGKGRERRGGARGKYTNIICMRARLRGCPRPCVCLCRDVLFRGWLTAAKGARPFFFPRQLFDTENITWRARRRTSLRPSNCGFPMHISILICFYYHFFSCPHVFESNFFFFFILWRARLSRVHFTRE